MINEEQMTPKQRQIVQAAIELISEKGYAATSTSEIAKRAGVAEGTIFRHYKTKQDLLFAIVHPVIIQSLAPVFADQFVDEVFRKSHPSAEDFLFHFIQNRFEFVKQNLPVIKIVLQELAFQPEIQSTYKRTFMEKVYPAMNRTLEHLKATGEFRDLDNEQIIRLVAPTIMGFLMTRFIIQPNKTWNDTEEIKTTVTYIMQGLKP
ncbi:putative HTH-type transcriptional regulator YvkB [Lentibacillus sp. JNUCC-1]|uniref:TetR/AcrR family transcriptional regulator n=1 Tax=Lentibacillus sp. JNUCC-1 TaxID=2654513 RepID=UPI0012E8915A|nr:TetR/AcrR family transcriptional regulator [Lentibacillus sp. JNUCC-1]MUV37763.1 putative HTH-type transcriptional regulator YvkB [Lentibacillus sp. JNUCC-1]